MAVLFDPHFQAIDGSGVPISDATLTFYLAGTTTKTTIYQDAAATTAHINPITADAEGLFAPIFVSTDRNFKFVLKDGSGETIQTADHVSPISGVNANTYAVASKSDLDAITPDAETDLGIVLADATASNNGYYYRSGSAWVKGRGFPDTFAQVTLAGTANAQTGTVSSSVDPSTITVYFAVVGTDNTGAMTLSIEGESARDVVNLAGSALSAGEWTGIVLFYLNGDGDYQLLVDAGAAAAAAQSATDAETAQAAAEAAKVLAEAAAASIENGIPKVRVVATSNLDLSAPGSSIDSVTLAEGETFLAAGQTATEENGPYTFNGAAVAATRLASYATFDKIAGQLFSVLEGTIYGGTFWHCTSAEGGTIDTDPLVFEEFGADLSAVDQDIIPDADSTRDLGDSTHAWAEVHADEVLTPAIQFPATQVPSADANTLDDYEEGTWTPVITFGTAGDLSVAYNNQVGVYTKIGRTVVLQLFILTSTFTHSSASGDVNITGVPFAAMTGTRHDFSGNGVVSGVTKANYTQFSLYISQSASLLLLNAVGSGQTVSTVKAADMPSGATVVVSGVITYFTS